MACNDLGFVHKNFRFATCTFLPDYSTIRGRSRVKRQRRECVFLKKRWAAAVAVSMLLSLGSVMAAAADETEAVQTENTTSERENAENGTAENTAGQTEETPEADPGNEETGTWKQEDGGWRYYGEDGTYKKNSWEQIGGYWYHFGRDGLMAAGWQKIGGYYYCFRETGDLAIGWCYNDEEEKWYYFDKDGTAKKGWFQDEDGSWYLSLIHISEPTRP